MTARSSRFLQWREQRGGSNPLRQRAENKTAEPVSVSVSQYWEGNDGPWSSFAIQIGKKAQDIRVLPSTASPNTWVVYGEGCPSDAPNNCADSRGGIFNNNNSLTWIPNSIFELGVEENLDYDVFGDFGFDTVTLGWQGSNGPSVEHSVVAGIADTTFTWLGVLGLNPRPTNFSTFPNSPQPSLIQLLKDQNSIPSLSWAYTAGAPYRLNKVFGSLTLGGYDQARFHRPSETAQDLTFPFYTDISRDLLVGISSIKTSNTTSSSSESALLKDGIFALIDSTVPHLWLPQSVCEAFEDAFGLTWDSTSELYTLNATQHSTLSKLNPTVTFQLSPELPISDDKSTSIAFPYSAFDLNVSWPYATDTTRYFPLKRAANDTQYTLGRAFLQEAYLIADYERQNFSVWPCKWDSDTTNGNIIPILSKDAPTNTSDPAGGNGNNNNSDTSQSSSNNGISSGAIAGIVIGVIAIIAAIAAWLYWRRRKSKSKASELEGNQADVTRAQEAINAIPVEAPQDLGVMEAPTNDKHFAPPPEELEGSRYVAHGGELDSTPRHEMVGQDGFPLYGAQQGWGTDIEGLHEADAGEKRATMHEMPAPYAGFGQKLTHDQAAATTAGPVPAWSDQPSASRKTDR
ncbi:acid protease [Karstenula rhodostoma CBS 690.94]|uniref:Acid protease n=1 Tax=Karstenula rhodostoma CBS 690.94 TaxID=1392251 RepID=A0A9P4P4S6_9PLEO|nr:acid protease [Karstenula rhodostoma CBS 690.94]